MPNIEIYDRKAAAAPHHLKKQIDEIMQGIGLGNDAITTIIDSSPMSCEGGGKFGEGKPMPFIRVCDTKADRIEKIIHAFKDSGLGVDVETLLLGGFIPADEMK